MTNETVQKGFRGWWAVPILLGIVAASYFGCRMLTLSSADSTVIAAQRALAEGDVQKARSLVDWVLYFEPEHRGASLVVGASYAAEGKYAEAIEYLDRVPNVGLEPNELDVKAASLIGDHQWDRAESLLMTACQDSELEQQLVDRLTRLYLAELRYEHAIELLNRYVVASGDKYALINVLELLATTQSPDAYLSELEVANNKRPEQKSVMLGLATGYALNGHIEEARALFEKTLLMRPDDRDVQLAAARFHVGVGETAEAAALLNQAKTDPRAEQDHAFWFLQARVAETAGDVGTASSHLKRAMSLSVPRETYLQTAARLARREGKREQAVTLASKAAQLAQRRQRLMALFPDVDVSRPQRELFAEVAAIVEQLGYQEQAELWLKLGERSP